MFILTIIPKRTLLLTLVLVSIIPAYGQHGKGLLLDDDRIFNIEKQEEVSYGYGEFLPDQYSLKKYAPIPGDQGMTPSCVGWAVAYNALTILYSMKYDITNKIWISTSVFDPYYVYNSIVDTGLICDNGTHIIDAYNLLMTNGAKRFYFEKSECGDAPSQLKNDFFSYFKISNYYLVFLRDSFENIDWVKRAVASGYPVNITMNTPESFEYVGSSGLWEPTLTEKDYATIYPGHAMCIVGYDDKLYGGVFEVINSWGTGWGSNGYGYIKYDDFKRFVNFAVHMEIDLDYEPSDCILGSCNSNYGRQVYENGTFYEGEFQNGYKQGYGMQCWEGWGIYIGQWENGEANGYGIYINEEGKYSAGIWKDHSLVSRESEEDYFLSGCLEGDCYNGYGKMQYSNGIYEGYFKNGSINGYGVYRWNNGDTYEGLYEDNYRSGIGKYSWPNEIVYIGEWKNDKKNGSGTMFYPSGSAKAGSWENDDYLSETGFADDDNQSVFTERITPVFVPGGGSEIKLPD